MAAEEDAKRGNGRAAEGQAGPEGGQTKRELEIPEELYIDTKITKRYTDYDCSRALKRRVDAGSGPAR